MFHNANRIYFLSLVVLILFSVMYYHAEAGELYLENIRFKLVDKNTGELLKYSTIDFCYFVYDAVCQMNEKWHIAEATTDQNGVFVLNLSRVSKPETNIKAVRIMFRVRDVDKCGSFEFSSNLAHMNSPFHIRVFASAPDIASFAGNSIYNLKNKRVRTIPFSDKKSDPMHDDSFEETKQFSEIWLGV